MSSANQLGRPVKFTPEVQQEIVRLVAEGNYLEVACQAAGVTSRLVRHYRKMWEDGDPSVSHLDDFFSALKKALALAESSSLRRIRSGVEGWQGSAWFLERRYPKRWAKREPEKPKGVQAGDPTDMLIPDDDDRHDDAPRVEAD